MPPYTYKWVFNTMHCVHGLWILHGRAAATEYQRRYPLCRVLNWNTFQTTKNFWEPDSIPRASAESWQTRLGENWRLDAARRGTKSHKFSIRKAIHLHAHLYKLDYASDRGQNKMLPANIWWNPFNISEAKHGEEASHQTPCPRKGGKFILSRINLSMQLYIKKPAEYGA
jgi:hypothetical protein